MNFIKNYDSLAKTSERKIVLDLIETALSSIQPENVISKNISLQDSILNIKDQNFDLKNFNRNFLVGFGKGSARISKILEQILGTFLTGGFVIDVTSEQFSKIHATVGTHPLPSQTNIDFTRNVVDKLSELTEKDLVLVVVVGGGSALFELPIIPLNELIKKNQELLKSGKNIYEMNKERAAFSKVKGGKFAKILSPAKVVGLIFSDVPGDNLSVVASGPTVDGLATNILMLSNKTALDAISQKASEFNIKATIYSETLQGEAREVGKLLIENCEENSLLFAGGETTVTVKTPGIGGRNQEVVLGALLNIDENTTIASFDTDGWDNTEFAGAIGDFKTLEKAKEHNLDPQKTLDENSSFEFFQKTEDGISTGRLPSNIADLMIVHKK